MAKKKVVSTKSTKSVYVSQSEFPRNTLEKSLTIARKLWDEFAGKNAEPHQIALALDLAPTSGGWRYLCGTSIAYGLTDGGYNASSIQLTPLGKSIVAPTDELEDKKALVVAALTPRISKTFFEKYDKAKFPSATIGENYLVSLGIPKERAKEAFEIIEKNGKFAGIIQESKTGLFVSVGVNGRQLLASGPQNGSETDQNLNPQLPEVDEPIKPAAPVDTKLNKRVFVSHGKNKQIVEQLKEIITFGKYHPVVSVENNTTSIPVPEKVFEDMRSCFAGVINVHSEGDVMDQAGNKHTKINDNVLIEIGAAIALYKKNYILLVQKGVQLPSNLQGLYRCEYEGEKLDAESTMKLLKTFNQFEG